MQIMFSSSSDDKEVQEFLNNSVAFKTKIESIQKGKRVKKESKNNADEMGF